MYRVLRHLSSLFIVLSMVTSQESDDYCIEYIQQSSATNAKSCSCDAIEKSCFCTLDDHDAILDPCTAAAVIEDITLKKGQNSSLASRQVVPDTGNKLDLTSFHPLLGVISDQLEPISHIGRLPSTPTEIRTKFMAYRTSGRGQYDLKYSDSSEIMKLKADISKMAAGVKLQKVYIVVHGFHEKIEGSYEYDTLKTRLAQQNPLIRDKPNSLIVMVDWSHGAKPKKGQGVIYTQAAINAVVVGRELAVICEQLVTNGLVNPVDFHLIGFGLGAQVIHFAARWFSTIHVNENVDSLLNLQEAVREDGFPSRPRIISQSVIKLGRLTGLDPTARHFQGFINPQGVIPYINRYDAIFVDIVHTSSVKMNGKFKDMIRGRFGMSTPVGHVDFYVNGGRKQPGCGKLAVTCNHKKALNYFISSLTTDPETKDYLLGVARENYVTHYTNIFNPSDVRGLVPSAVAVLGIEAESTIGWGVFYMFLITTSNFEVKDIRELIPAKYDGLLYETNELENGGVPDPGSVFKRYPIHNLTEIETRSMDFTTDTAACGQFRQSGNNTGRVQNGHQPYAGQFPWVVCILKYQDEFSGYGTMCTGTILTDEFIVTAGHCFWRREEGVIMPKEQGFLIYLSFGTSDCMRPLIWRAVVMDFNVTVFSHPSYKYGTNIYDIGLIKLLKPLTGLPESVYNGELINTICYDSSHTFSYACGENVYFSGYGAKEQDVPAPHLTWTHISPIDTKLSTALNQIVRFKTPEVLHPSNVRFRNNEHGVVRQPCGGDSGGPYVWYVQDEKSKTPSPEVSPYRAVLIGTEIGGPACKDPVRDPDLGNLLGFEMGTKFQDRFIHRWVVETMRERSRKVRKDVAIPPAPSFLENRPPFFVDKGFGLD